MQTIDVILVPPPVPAGGLWAGSMTSLANRKLMVDAFFDPDNLLGMNASSEKEEEAIQEAPSGMNPTVHDNTLFYDAHDSKTGKEFYVGPEVPDPDPENLHFYNPSDMIATPLDAHAISLSIL